MTKQEVIKAIKEVVRDNGTRNINGHKHIMWESGNFVKEVVLNKFRNGGLHYAAMNALEGVCCACSIEEVDGYTLADIYNEIMCCDSDERDDIEFCVEA